ncbi:hypothetical protein Halha_0965 [Halobacteroides halobius DSM 5150]|uniref:Uncharacterized protein n=1 Tax=Halobacteroides halobius (strain ATCC 35273 / DSM 5150 / MD-1) TaxID=748449 RepID=L0K7E3_HALHC|nr:hypothetical protein Halha_0965 [Halobacteroides halobius DSM 5150]
MNNEQFTIRVQKHKPLYLINVETGRALYMVLIVHCQLLIIN